VVHKGAGADQIGALAADAAQIRPGSVTLKRDEFKLIGPPSKRLDTPLRSTERHLRDRCPTDRVKIATLAQSQLLAGG